MRLEERINEEPASEYTHGVIGEDVHFISGYYRLEEEVRLPYGEKELFYVLGVGVLDNSCCGLGGCLFIQVPGYLVSWKARRDESNREISMVTPILSEAEQVDIKKLLKKQHPYAQVAFV